MPPLCRLYLLTPPALPDLDGFCERLEAALDAGDVAAVQNRLQYVPDDLIRRATEAILPLVQYRGVAAIMYDRPDLARELGCD